MIFLLLTILGIVLVASLLLGAGYYLSLHFGWIPEATDEKNIASSPAIQEPVRLVAVGDLSQLAQMTIGKAELITGKLVYEAVVVETAHHAYRRSAGVTRGGYVTILGHEMVARSSNTGTNIIQFPKPLQVMSDLPKEIAFG